MMIHGSIVIHSRHTITSIIITMQIKVAFKFINNNSKIALEKELISQITT